MKIKTIVIGGGSIDAIAAIISYANATNKPILVVNSVNEKEMNKAFQPEPIPILNHRLDFHPEVTNIKNWEPNKYFDKPKDNFKKK